MNATLSPAAEHPAPEPVIHTCPAPSRAVQLWRQFRWQAERRALRRATTVRRVQGFDMELDLQVRGVSGTLAMRGVREFDHTTILERELTEGMVCIDAGANIGYNTLLMARRVGASGKVLAVEPDPRNFPLLERNVQRNGYAERVELLAAAVADRPGRAHLVLTDRSNLNTLAVEEGQTPPHGSPGTVETPICTIDALINERGGRLDFLRMDIEGFEVDALRGAMSSLAAAPTGSRILMEVHPERYGEHRDFGEVLNRLFAVHFTPKLVISSARGSAAIASKGYRPAEYFQEREVRRGAFPNVGEDDCIAFCTQQPKIVRYLLLEKTVGPR